MNILVFSLIFESSASFESFSFWNYASFILYFSLHFKTKFSCSFLFSCMLSKYFFSIRSNTFLNSLSRFLYSICFTFFSLWISLFKYLIVFLSSLILKFYTK